MNRIAENIDLYNEDGKTDFSIKLMEKIHTEQDDKPDQPHRHNYYSILWPTEKVKGKHIIDFCEFPIKKNGVFFLTPGQVHQFLPKEKPYGFVILFSNDFLLKSKIDKDFVENLKIFNSFLSNEPLQIDSVKAEKMNHYIHEMLKAEEGNYYYDTIGSNLKLFLIECVTACNADLSPNNETFTLMDQFKLLVDQKYNTEHKVKYYSDKLVISAGHLNNIVKNSTGLSAKKFIQERVLLEAKRLLLFSDLSAKETAFDLGFSDPLHFSKFIKNQTGNSIKDLVKQYKSELNL